MNLKQTLILSIIVVVAISLVLILKYHLNYVIIFTYLFTCIPAALFYARKRNTSGK